LSANFSTFVFYSYHKVLSSPQQSGIVYYSLTILFSKGGDIAMWEELRNGLMKIWYKNPELIYMTIVFLAIVAFVIMYTHQE